MVEGEEGHGPGGVHSRGRGQGRWRGGHVNADNAAPDECDFPPIDKPGLHFPADFQPLGKISFFMLFSHKQW